MHSSYHHASPPPFRVNNFNTDLFDCCEDFASCMDVTLCLACHISAQYHMLRHQQPRVDMTLAIPLCMANIVCLGSPTSCFAIHTRSLARARMHLFHESGHEGCCIACWCAPCSFCQVYREMSIRHMWPGGVLVDVPYCKPGLIMSATAPPSPLRMCDATSWDGGLPDYLCSHQNMHHVIPEGHPPSPLLASPMSMHQSSILGYPLYEPLTLHSKSPYRDHEGKQSPPTLPIASPRTGGF
jgi:Cys-rich protein (TIGR01571 family)